MVKGYTFSDVLIIPKYSEIITRSDVDVTSNFNSFSLKLPIFAANMKTICGPNMAIEMYNNGGMGVLHRFCTIEQAVKDFKNVSMNLPFNETHNVSVSIGVQEADKERFDKLYEAGAKIICIDIAQGHHVLMKNMVKWICEKNLKDVVIIAGNIVTKEAIYDLTSWGVNICKCGIGGGFACRTRKYVGVGYPQLSTLENIRDYIDKCRLNVKIISDGGITNSGDICKAMKFADGVMIGNLISGTTETPGNVFEDAKGHFYKVYSGSASGESKFNNNQSIDHIEGITTQVPFRGKVKYILKKCKESLQSAFSYVGAKNLEEFKNKCEFVELSNGAKQESAL